MPHPLLLKYHRILLQMSEVVDFKVPPFKSLLEETKAESKGNEQDHTTCEVVKSLLKMTFKEMEFFVILHDSYIHIYACTSSSRNCNKEDDFFDRVKKISGFTAYIPYSLFFKVSSLLYSQRKLINWRDDSQLSSKIKEIALLGLPHDDDSDERVEKWLQWFNALVDLHQEIITTSRLLSKAEQQEINAIYCNRTHNVRFATHYGAWPVGNLPQFFVLLMDCIDQPKQLQLLEATKPLQFKTPNGMLLCDEIKKSWEEKSKAETKNKATILNVRRFESYSLNLFIGHEYYDRSKKLVPAIHPNLTIGAINLAIKDNSVQMFIGDVFYTQHPLDELSKQELIVECHKKNIIAVKKILLRCAAKTIVDFLPESEKQGGLESKRMAQRMVESNLNELIRALNENQIKGITFDGSDAGKIQYTLSSSDEIFFINVDPKQALSETLLQGIENNFSLKHLKLISFADLKIFYPMLRKHPALLFELVENVYISKSHINDLKEIIEFVKAGKHTFISPYICHYQDEPFTEKELNLQLDALFKICITQGSYLDKKVHKSKDNMIVAHNRTYEGSIVKLKIFSCSSSYQLIFTFKTGFKYRFEVLSPQGKQLIEEMIRRSVRFQNALTYPKSVRFSTEEKRSLQFWRGNRVDNSLMQYATIGEHYSQIVHSELTRKFGETVVAIQFIIDNLEDKHDRPNKKVVIDFCGGKGASLPQLVIKRAANLNVLEGLSYYLMDSLRPETADCNLSQAKLLAESVGLPFEYKTIKLNVEVNRDDKATPKADVLFGSGSVLNWSVGDPSKMQNNLNYVARLLKPFGVVLLSGLTYLMPTEKDLSKQFIILQSVVLHPLQSREKHSLVPCVVGLRIPSYEEVPVFKQLEILSQLRNMLSSNEEFNLWRLDQYIAHLSQPEPQQWLGDPRIKKPCVYPVYGNGFIMMDSLPVTKPFNHLSFYGRRFLEKQRNDSIVHREVYDSQFGIVSCKG